jgi:hypothetical protein
LNREAAKGAKKTFAFFAPFAVKSFGCGWKPRYECDV